MSRFVKGHTVNFSHGHASRATGCSREWRAWSNMRQRCEQPSDRAYARYGGRGITVCERWSASFEAFLTDMGPHPGPGYTLERIDNDAGYGPANCRWATVAEQNRNRRICRKITVSGRCMCLAEWARELRVGVDLLRYRVRKGQTWEETIQHFYNLRGIR